MNNIKIWVLVLCLVGCVESARDENVMSGEVRGIKYGKVFISDLEDSILYTTGLENSRFEIKGEPLAPGVYHVRVNQWKRELLLGGKNITLDLNYYDETYHLAGSPENDSLVAFQRMIQERVYSNVSVEIGKDLSQEERDEIVSRTARREVLRVEYTRDFVKERPDHVVSAYVANMVKGTDYDAGLEMYNLLSEEVKNTSIGKLLKKNVDALEISGYGKSFPAVQVENMQGEKIVLDDLKGSITVVDFWASWCGPCRQEIPYLKKLYESLKGKNVKFVSLSMDDNSKKWLKACEKEQIPWRNVRNLDGYNKNVGVCKILSIQRIPYILILDEDGKIVGKDLLRNNLRDKLFELLKINEK